MNYKDNLQMLEFEINYLLDSYNYNLKNNKGDENEKIMKDLEDSQKQLLSLKSNLNFDINTDPESIFNFLKANTLRELSDKEISSHVDTIIQASQGEEFLKYFINLLVNTAYYSQENLKVILEGKRI